MRSPALDPVRGPQRRSDRTWSPAFKDGWLDQEGNSTGDLTLRLEVARVWRLGRRLAFSCNADPEDPFEEWVQGRLVRGEDTRSQALVFLTPARALQNGSSVFVIP